MSLWRTQRRFHRGVFALAGPRACPRSISARHALLIAPVVVVPTGGGWRGNGPRRNALLLTLEVVALGGRCRHRPGARHRVGLKAHASRWLHLLDLYLLDTRESHRCRVLRTSLPLTYVLFQPCVLSYPISNAVVISLSAPGRVSST